MNAQSAATESVVRNHLQAFLERKGVPAMLDDYSPNARLYGEAKVNAGTREIHDFLIGFLDGLPEGAIERFALRALHVYGNFAYITWSAGREIPLGTDTFVVEDGKIVSQTFVLHDVRGRADGASAQA